MDNTESKPEGTPSNQAPASAASPTTDFLKRVDDDMQATLKAEKTRVGFTAAMLIFVICYMSFMFIQLGKADAEVLTKRAGEFVEESLPAWEIDLQKYAMEQAPKAIQDGKKLVLEAPRKLRLDLQAKLHDTTRTSIKQMQDEMAPKMRILVKQHAHQLKKKSNAEGATPDDALAIVTAALVKEFRDQSQLYMKLHYGDFLVAIRDLNKRMERLRTHPQLEADERLQREIIGATVVLVHKYHPINDDDQIRANWNKMKRDGDGK